METIIKAQQYMDSIMHDLSIGKDTDSIEFEEEYNAILESKIKELGNDLK